jgi:hypothetical protein
MQPYENVYLATNGHGSTRFDLKSNMYLVLITSAEHPLEKPGMVITASTVGRNDLPALAIDGDVKTRWTAVNDDYPQWLKLDLGQVCNISSYKLTWYKNDKRAYRYLIELSDDDKTYQTSLDKQGNNLTGINDFLIPPGKTNHGRYVRVTVTGGGRASIIEMVVNGTPTNIAQ